MLKGAIACICMHRRKNFVIKQQLLLIDMQFFDLRILFLITALTPSTRSILRCDLEAAKVLHDLLNIYLDHAALLEVAQQPDFAEREVQDSDADLLVELAKVIYNLVITLERHKPTVVSDGLIQAQVVL